MLATRAFARQLVAYITAILPTAPYFKSTDGRISAVCNGQYSSTLAMLEETANWAFKVYITSKTQGWFRRWGPCPSAAAAPVVAAAPCAAAAPCRAGGGAGTPTRRAKAPVVSNDEEGTDLISQDNNETKTSGAGRSRGA